MEFIAINPVEQRRPTTEQREWIKQRDKYCLFPIVVNGKLEDVKVIAPASLGECHHIHPIHHLKTHYPKVDPNHPANLITLDHKTHEFLHRGYGCDDINWWNGYDEYLSSIAIINSFDYMMSHEKIPFFPEQVEQDIYDLYQCLDGEFLDRFRHIQSNKS